MRTSQFHFQRMHGQSQLIRTNNVWAVVIPYHLKTSHEDKNHLNISIVNKPITIHDSRKCFLQKHKK